jgi:hypothetical protein
MAASRLEREIKIALDETRLLLLGVQILIGFQFTATFQELFPAWSATARHLHAVGLLLMVAAMALLIAPSLQHRLVEKGHADRRIVQATGKFADAALLPFALSLGIDHFNVFAQLFGATAGIAAGLVFFAAAATFWFILVYAVRRPDQGQEKMASEHGKSSITDRVDHMLTEARVVLPGAQALLGFQLSVVLMQAFAELPESYKIVHAAALGCVALSVILLMAPAVFHRIAFRGQEDEDLHRIGSRFIVAATVPLAAGIVADVFVATAKAMDNATTGIVFAAIAAVILVLFWYVQPLALRRNLSARR